MRSRGPRLPTEDLASCCRRRARMASSRADRCGSWDRAVVSKQPVLGPNMWRGAPRPSGPTRAVREAWLTGATRGRRQSKRLGAGRLALRARGPVRRRRCVTRAQSTRCRTQMGVMSLGGGFARGLGPSQTDRPYRGPRDFDGRKNVVGGCSSASRVHPYPRRQCAIEREDDGQNLGKRINETSLEETTRC